jgi:hypothetical protein
MNTLNPTTKYIELLKQADKTTSRKEAIYLINLADKLRMEMTLHTNPS